MSKIVSLREYDSDTQIEEITTTWDDGSTTIVKNNLKKGKTKIQVLDCTDGKREIHQKKFKLDPIFGSVDASIWLLDWVTKFNDANE